MNGLLLFHSQSPDQRMLTFLQSWDNYTCPGFLAWLYLQMLSFIFRGHMSCFLKDKGCGIKGWWRPTRKLVWLKFVGIFVEVPCITSRVHSFSSRAAKKDLPLLMESWKDAVMKLWGCIGIIHEAPWYRSPYWTASLEASILVSTSLPTWWDTCQVGGLEGDTCWSLLQLWIFM